MSENGKEEYFSITLYDVIVSANPFPVLHKDFETIFLMCYTLIVH